MFYVVKSKSIGSRSSLCEVILSKWKLQVKTATGEKHRGLAKPSLVLHQRLWRCSCSTATVQVLLMQLTHEARQTDVLLLSTALSTDLKLFSSRCEASPTNIFILREAPRSDAIFSPPRSISNRRHWSLREALPTEVIQFATKHS